MSNSRDEASDRLSEYGIPVDALKDFVGGMLQDLTVAQGQAQRIQADYPELGTPEFANFVAGDAALKHSLQRMSQVDAGAAIEYAALRYRQARPGQPQSQAQPERSSSPARPWASAPIHAGDSARESNNVYIQRRLRQAIHHPDIDDAERRGW